MSKLHGPLFSFSAHGRLSELLQYQDSAAGPRVQKATDPAQPRTAAQLAQRARYRAALDAWLTRPAPVFDVKQWFYAARELGSRFSELNAFMHFNLEAQLAGLTWHNNEWKYFEPSGANFVYVQVSDNGQTVAPVARYGLTTAARTQSQSMSATPFGFWETNLGPFPPRSVVWAVSEYDDGAGTYGRSGLIRTRTG